MMHGETQARFFWRKGRPFGSIAKTFVDFFRCMGYGFEKIPDGKGTGIFMAVSGATGSAERLRRYTDTPWVDDPWRNPDTRYVCCNVLSNENATWRWASFYIWREENVKYQEAGNSSLVYLLQMFIDGCLWKRSGENEEQFQDLRRKYELIKELWRAMACDEVFAWDEYYLPNPKFLQLFPHHRDKLLRFAKEGTQVLVRRMEECRQLPTPTCEWPKARIFVDPPGVETLTPEEYEKRWAEYLRG